jgi:type IV secretion system protein VirB9
MMCKALIRFVSLSLMLGAITLFSNHASAVRESKPMPIDKRLRVMVYNPNDVFKFTGYYGYQSSIVFAEGEEVDTLTMGDTVAWQIVPSGNRIFLKPMEPDATTNMTILTNERVYHFELHAKEAKNINDPDMVFSVRFIYPDTGSSGAVQKFATADNGPDLSDPSKYNFNYTISGPEFIAPIKIFDDGEFTYLEFKDKNAEIPAIYWVDSNNQDVLINYRISGKYLVIERVSDRFTLRHGADVGCIFNEALRAERKKGR